MARNGAAWEAGTQRPETSTATASLIDLASDSLRGFMSAERQMACDVVFDMAGISLPLTWQTRNINSP